ncbi:MULTISPECIES: adenylate/guanylate cyclase domain-containing protein [unclassified Leptolyngbya]|uniref:adenylate/guanylate cyclase domain-containing protein n=1 Tax=unclassified Leptolyngbya TaxID=2650499 RepID=UPI001682F2B2|nr:MULTISPECIES: adenylate/guanylate cyclase domain-containing protein [unclassified Leptolyngbya]MBD1912796.1 PAS domain S-box protein [Leptolyngbya sp. FACHB-8]MBD2157743.1 PAS domain S-box protein [Leptolyngbya sp. FACHB-16]
MEPNVKIEPESGSDVAVLREELARLKQENEDLRITLQATVEHGDVVEATLRSTNERLQAEVTQRQMAETALQDILSTVLRDKQDLELILKATAEHGDALEYQLYTQAVETMRESEALFRAIAESTPILMILTQRLDGVISFANITSRDHLGLEPQALVGHKLRDFMVNPDAEEHLLERLQTEGHVRNYEMQIRRVDGQEVWVSASVHSLQLGGNQALLTTLYDISDRRRAEAALLDYQQRLEQQAQELEQRVEQRSDALLQVEAKYRSIFENAVEGIYQISPQGRYLSANPALAEILGYDSPEELMESIVSLDRQLYVQPQRRFELIAYLSRFESASDFESEVYCKDGTKIWVAENVRLIRDAAGKVVCYEGSVQNITTRRQTEAELRHQRKRTEQLLLNIMPQAIAERLKRGQKTIVDSFTRASVLFADIANFTALSTDISPVELVELLNAIFTAFDELATFKGLEKIKTIGDAYMVVGGVPTPIPDPIAATAEMALAMQELIRTFHTPTGIPLSLRIGIHTGPVIAGIIGTRKFSYDLWGDTVNVASRMETQGEPGRIQVTESVYEKLKDDYRFEKREIIEIKGKGLMQTYWLTGKKPSWEAKETTQPE